MVAGLLLWLSSSCALLFWHFAKALGSISYSKGRAGGGGGGCDWIALAGLLEKSSSSQGRGSLPGPLLEDSTIPEGPNIMQLPTEGTSFFKESSQDRSRGLPQEGL